MNSAFFLKFINQRKSQNTFYRVWRICIMHGLSFMVSFAPVLFEPSYIGIYMAARFYYLQCHWNEAPCVFRCNVCNIGNSNTILLVGALQETVGTHVVDGVMEDIRLGMEVNLPKYSQRRVATIKYLGELYNYRMVESSDIFKAISHFFPFIDKLLCWYHKYCLNVFIAWLECITNKGFFVSFVRVTLFLLLHAWWIKIVQV